MKKRLIEFLKYLKIGQDKFAKKVGVSRGYVNNIQDNITVKTMDKIIKAYPQLNKIWLLTGEGEMLNNHSEKTPNEINKTIQNQEIENIFEYNFSEIIAIEKANAETGRINAESFKQIAESNVTLVKNNDKLIEIIKDILSDKNEF